MSILIKRVYDAPSQDDGRRILVDRLWPRGLKKETAQIDDWLKDIAPSHDLRKWFGHDPSRWDDFQKQYREELASGDAHEALAILKKLTAQKGTFTLLFAAKDEEHNNAVVLRALLEKPSRKPSRKR